MTTKLPLTGCIRRKLACKRGLSMYLLALIIFVSLVLLLTAILEATRAMIVYTGVRDAVESAITTTATSNAYNTYNGVREGNSGAYTPDGSGGWSETVTTADVVYKLRSLLGLESQGGGYVKLKGDGSGYEFKISQISVEAEITPLGDNIQQSTYHTTCLVEVPFDFGFGYLPDMQIHMRHQSTYVPRF
ncbi:MAG: TadE/TadG family type IV pilus assembly protein [Acetanaerobacterium sp.]